MYNLYLLFQEDWLSCWLICPFSWRQHLTIFINRWLANHSSFPVSYSFWDITCCTCSCTPSVEGVPLESLLTWSWGFGGLSGLTLAFLYPMFFRINDLDLLQIVPFLFLLKWMWEKWMLTVGNFNLSYL